MPEFIVRAHSAPTDPERLLAGVGGDAHVEYLAQVMMSALFVSKGHRDEVTLTLVLENSRDFSRAISFVEGTFGDFGGQTEANLVAVLANCLSEAQGLGKEASVVTEIGVRVAAISFEHIAKARLATSSVFLLDRKGKDVRDVRLDDDAVFLLTDHVPMPKNLQKSIIRMGATPVSVGPVMLHASQCIAVVQNELDRRR